MDRLWRSSGLDTACATDQGDLAAFRQRMQELGWAEGHNLAVETRWAEGRRDRLPRLAADLVQLPVDVIVTITTPAAQAAIFWHHPAWGDTLTEQLAHDILMDQQQESIPSVAGLALGALDFRPPW